MFRIRTALFGALLLGSLSTPALAGDISIYNENNNSNSNFNSNGNSNYAGASVFNQVDLGVSIGITNKNYLSQWQEQDQSQQQDQWQEDSGGNDGGVCHDAECPSDW